MNIEDDDFVTYLKKRDVITLVQNFETIIDDLKIMQSEELTILLDDLKERREWFGRRQELELGASDWLAALATRVKAALPK